MNGHRYKKFFTISNRNLGDLLKQVNMHEKGGAWLYSLHEPNDLLDTWTAVMYDWRISPEEEDDNG